MLLRSGKLLVGAGEHANARSLTTPESPPEDEVGRKKIGIFDLPVEIRIRIYGYLCQMPGLVRPEELGSALRIPDDDDEDHDAWKILKQDFRAHVLDIFFRHTPVLFNSNSDELIDTISRQPERVVRRFRYIRFGGRAVIDQLSRYLASGAWDLDELKEDFDAFDRALPEKIDYLYTLPRDTTFAKLDSLWLPNLQTLTLDVGRIDEEPQPCYGYNNTWGHWSLWLDESDAVRNNRYHGILQRIQARIPERVSRSLRVIVNAKMDPEGPGRLNQRMPRGECPILYVKLEYKVADKNIVAIEERWGEWSYYRFIGRRRQITEMAEKLEVRSMDWHGPTAETPESWSVPIWKELGGDMVIQGGMVVEADEQGGVDS